MQQAWINTRAYGGFTIATETFTQKSSQLAVSEWNMGHACWLTYLWVISLLLVLTLSQACDAKPEGWDRLVDVLCFFKSLVLRACFGKAFGACKINDCQECFPIVLLFKLFCIMLVILLWRSLFNPNLFQEYVKYCMWSTRVDIHSSLIDLSPSHALLYKLQQLVLRLNMNLIKAINKYSSFWIFSYL